MIINLISTQSSSTREERAANAALAAIEGQRFYTWEKSDRKHAAMKEKVKILFQEIKPQEFASRRYSQLHGQTLSLESDDLNNIFGFCRVHFPTGSDEETLGDPI